MNFSSSVHQVLEAVLWMLVTALLGLLTFKLVAPWMNSLPLSVVSMLCSFPVFMAIDANSLADNFPKAEEGGQ